MSHHPPRNLSRRRLLTSASAALGTALVLPHASVAASAVDRILALTFDSDAIVVSTQDALWHISATGAERQPQTEAITALASHPARPGTLHAALQRGGLRRSLDGGQSWEDAGDGHGSARILALSVAAGNPDTLYAAAAGDGLYRSEDAGKSWAFVMDRPYLDGAEHDVLSMVSVATPSGMGGIWLYAGTAAGLTRVPDCFCRWQDVTAGDAMEALASGQVPAPANGLPKGQAITALALAPEAPDQLYAGLASGLWVSSDAGVNWSRASGGAAEPLAVDPADPRHLVAARADGLSVSRDGGATWTIPNFFKET
ncbi:WD40/YVTN/BNR-like repeat-containing protein [Puniceibacterium confluentis]|uniref:WD40/YVTN/BNR-like repeat-containing protein n=2 Tax=Puniceibacterium confluentis TaxID=1958944 RepID=UPI001646C7F6|nr:sialidase family protein [Puniceibacterium confluentis]